jgi:hypothetical protein
MQRVRLVLLLFLVGCHADAAKESTAGSTLFRLEWVRSFHDPIYVWTSVTDRGREIHWMRWDGWTAPRDSGSRELDSFEWETLATRFDEAGFCGLSEQAPEPNLPPGQEMVRLDGAEWTLISLCSGRRHQVMRWGGDLGGTDSSVRVLGLYLGRLAGIGVDSANVY